MAFDAFLKIKGEKMGELFGESRDDRYKGWIELLSYSFGARQPAHWVDREEGAAAERCDIDVFTISKKIDQASALLFLACCQAERLKEFKLELCRASGKKEKYFEVQLSDAIVSSVHSHGPGPAGGGDSLPTEDVSLVFREIEITYTPTDPQTGRPTGPVMVSWEVRVKK